ncbi:SDR family oxidoreductase [Paenibacillus sp. JCM 10914]|uniref:SDR family NAD(P)-dependent oxidoreductase n=1 Tax=Paenibacillus sp. JCM 10914 TaxID=1236974 RepID=UPI0003CC579D|nr:SDR family NAD(P)-dependent oxidoreductase [Paenibacillus sp. JCM 10914]GAE08344.1 protein-L-isoD(D-D) O-methyltransferase [Paenibacillus sp. JCM 10914]
MSRLAGKAAVITGGAGGIGKITAERFLKEGAKVVIVDLMQDALDQAKSELEAHGDITAIQADVTNESEVESYVKQASDHLGKIDIFFNNAGIEGKVAPLVDQNVKDFDQVLSVNVRGVFLGMKYVLPHLIKQGSGSVINTSSVAGLDGSPGVSPYIASKHAVVGLTKTAAIEVAGSNVRVNSIHPSPVNTRMMRSLESGMKVDEHTLAKTIPLGRYGETVDIANLVLFLASDESTFITGAQYRIDGGMGAL